MKTYTEKELNGFCLELGYSIGGWGYRQDFIPKHSVEICDSCFNTVKEKSIEFELSINNLKKRIKS